MIENEIIQDSQKIYEDKVMGIFSWIGIFLFLGCMSFALVVLVPESVEVDGNFNSIRVFLLSLMAFILPTILLVLTMGIGELVAKGTNFGQYITEHIAGWKKTVWTLLLYYSLFEIAYRVITFIVKNI